MYPIVTKAPPPLSTQVRSAAGNRGSGRSWARQGGCAGVSVAVIRSVEAQGSHTDFTCATTIPQLDTARRGELAAAPSTPPHELAFSYWVGRKSAIGTVERSPRKARLMKLVVVGGFAEGASVAARARRLDESAEIIVLERGHHVSFANCGLPYHIGEAVVYGVGQRGPSRGRGSGAGNARALSRLLPGQGGT